MLLVWSPRSPCFFFLLMNERSVISSHGCSETPCGRSCPVTMKCQIFTILLLFFKKGAICKNCSPASTPHVRNKEMLNSSFLSSSAGTIWQSWTTESCSILTLWFKRRPLKGHVGEKKIFLQFTAAQCAHVYSSSRCHNILKNGGFISEISLGIPRALPDWSAAYISSYGNSERTHSKNSKNTKPLSPSSSQLH